MNPIRIAIVDDGRASRVVASYLPANYWCLGRTLDNTGTIIAGRDEGVAVLEWIMQQMAADDLTCREQHMIAPTQAELIADRLESDIDVLANIGKPMAATMLINLIRELRS